MLNAMTDEEILAIAGAWLNPIDSIIADLLDKSERMTVGAFYKEVESVVEKIPQLFGQLDTKALTDALESEIGNSIIEGLDQ
jgi:hypothetical protein